jgi:hypothetical protein
VPTGDVGKLIEDWKRLM